MSDRDGSPNTLTTELEREPRSAAAQQSSFLDLKKVGHPARLRQRQLGLHKSEWDLLTDRTNLRRFSNFFKRPVLNSTFVACQITIVYGGEFDVERDAAMRELKVSKHSFDMAWIIWPAA